LLENLYIHKTYKSEFPDLYRCIVKYINTEENEAISILESFLYQFNVQSFYASWILKDARRNIFALGKASEINKYKNRTLNDFIIKHRDIGSFDLWVEILNFLRLSLLDNKKIDISSIALFWTKYYQRKDYSLLSIDAALKVFETMSYVNMIDSCYLINKIQDVSEKGYRGLLASFIQQYTPNVISFMVKNFNLEDLRISWFDLPCEYINAFPEIVFNIALKKILEYHRYNKEIDFEEISNVFDSNWSDELKNILNLTKYKVRISKNNSSITNFKNNEINIVEYTPDNKYDSYKKNSETHYNQGILSIEDKEFILQKELKSYEVAGFSNGNYSAFVDLDIYKLFEVNDIKENIKPILYNAMLGKTKSINSFFDLYFFPGNLPKFIYDYNINTDLNKLFQSFLIFLELSMFGLNSITSTQKKGK
jgi:hypothetical protein